MSEIPKGWKLVPEDPDQAMCQAAQWKLREWPKFPFRVVPAYKAMLAAAPAQPETWKVLPSPGAPSLPPLDDTMREILGRPNFMCITLAKQLRLRGHTIANRSEDEQAAVIYFLLSLYLEHGKAWLDKGDEYFDRPLPAASTGEPIQEAKE